MRGQLGAIGRQYFQIKLSMIVRLGGRIGGIGLFATAQHVVH